MTESQTKPQPQFEAKALAQKCFRFWRQNFLPLTLTSLVLTLPLHLLLPLITGTTTGTPALSSLLQSRDFIVLLLLSILAFFFSIPILMLAVARRMQGKSGDAGAILRTGAKRFFPMLGTSVLFGFALALGGILLVIPAFIAAAAFYLALPYCIVSNKGPIESLRLSARLTKGFRWKIMGYASLLLLFQIALSFVVNIVFGTFDVVLGHYVDFGFFQDLGLPESYSGVMFWNALQNSVVYPLSYIFMMQAFARLLALKKEAASPA